MFWSVKTDNPAVLTAFSPDDADEFILAVDVLTPAALLSWTHATSLPPEKIRFALPMITRTSAGDGTRLAEKVAALRACGWRKWEISQWGQKEILGQTPPGGKDLDVTADWPLYVLNLTAAEFLSRQGLKRFTASPEDERENLRQLLPALAERLQVVLYQDTPLFTGEGCPRSAGRVEQSASCACNHQPFILTTRRGQEYLTLSRNCRTTVVSAEPYCISGYLEELRAWGMCSARVDFCWRAYEPAAARDIFRSVKQGETIPGTHSGNYLRGLQ